MSVLGMSVLVSLLCGGCTDSLALIDPLQQRGRPPLSVLTATVATGPHPSPQSPQSPLVTTSHHEWPGAGRVSGGRRARRGRRGRRGSEELQLCLLSSEAPGQDLPALPPDVLDSRYWQLSCWSKELEFLCLKMKVSTGKRKSQDIALLHTCRNFIL